MTCTTTPGLHNDGCECQPDNQENVGFSTLYRRQDRDGRPPYYLISWNGMWLPGLYDTRDTALLAIGIVAGGERNITIDDIRQRAARDSTNPNRGRITTQTIMNALGDAANS